MRLIGILVAVIIVTACGTAADGGPDTSTTNPSTTTTGEQASDSANDTSTTPETDMDIEQQAIADLAVRLGVAEDDIETMRVEAVTWPDGSLGCPQPGEMYTQALVEGHRIVLGHAERVFLYHSGAEEAPFLCPSDEKDGGYDFIPPPGLGGT